MKLQFAGALLLSSGLALNTAYAASGHSDIGFEVHGTAIELTIGEHDHGHDHATASADKHHEEEQPMTKDGKAIFEADFGDFKGGADVTYNPGYAAAGDLPNSKVFSFQGEGKLSYWDGKTWTNNTTSTITFTDAVGNDSKWTQNGYTAGASSYLGESTATGGFHEHIKYSISNSAAVGAYMVQLKIADPESKLLPSDSFYIVFNRGLSNAAFEASVDALKEVPVPAAAWLMLSGLVGLGMAKRKQA